MGTWENGGRGVEMRTSAGLVQRGREPAALETAAEVDEDDKTVGRGVLIVSFLQIFLTSFYYTVVLPTSRQYAESLNAPDHFEGFMVGAAAVGGALMNPLYRLILKRSFSACMHFQMICMQLGSVLYSLAQVANKIELLIAGRLLGGCGASLYPVYQFVAEEVGKKHRSKVLTVVSGFGKSFGFALGPIFAACLAYVDFQIGDMKVDKETVPGWTVAFLCLFQTFLIVWFFPRKGSRLIGKEKVSRDLPQATNRLPLRQRVAHVGALIWIVVVIAVTNSFISAWQIEATKVIQLNFRWSVQWSALLVGGISFTPAFVSPVLGKLSYRFQDREILVVSSVVQLASTALLFDYGSPIPFLLGSLVIFNAFTSQVTFMLALASKVSFVQEVDIVMSAIGYTTVLRAPGFVLGTYLTMNEQAATLASGSLAVLLGTLLFYTRLVPN